MRKLFLFVFTIFFLTSGIKAQLLTESFIAAPGADITTLGWTTFSGTINPLLVVSPTLDFPNYQLPGFGNSCAMQNNGFDYSKVLSSNVTSGSIYAFFLVNVSNAQAVTALGDYFAAFLPSASTTNFCTRVFIRKAITQTNKFAFGIAKNAVSGGATVYGDSTFTYGVTYLVVAKLTIVAGTPNDQVSLFTFSTSDPLPSIEPTPNIGPIGGTTADVPDIGKFVIRQGGATLAPTLVIDEIFIGTDWGTVLPVELNSFTSATERNNVNLNWATSSESNNSGFEIERSSDNSEWNKIGFLNGNGTTTSAHSYSFTDRNLESGKYNFRLKQIDFNGNFEYHILNNEVNIGTPDKFNLSQNYPNPFNPTTKINYNIPFDSKVSIKLFDLSGKELKTLYSGERSAGYYTMDFNASDISSGAYFYKISANQNGNNFTSTKKMVVLK